MKRQLALALALVLALVLCACNGSGQPASGSDARDLPPASSSGPPAGSSSPDAGQATGQTGGSKNDGQGGGQDADDMPAGDVDSDLGAWAGGLLDETRLLLLADFSAGIPDMAPSQKDIPLPPAEDMPASDAAMAFYLADALTEWSGLDFTLNDVQLGEDSIYVDWSPSSTLIAGLDDRQQKPDFFFYDAISLNWFMMDSLASTLKVNFQVMNIYYSVNGEDITFTNPEDMASQGLPSLPASQPYEGSAFYVSHAGVQ